MWIKHCRLSGYADDTVSSYSSADENEVIDKLKSDAVKILQFMSSNSLVANSKKTGFLLIRNGKQTPLRSVMVGGEKIEEESEQKILGVTLSNKLTWWIVIPTERTAC